MLFRFRALKRLPLDDTKTHFVAYAYSVNPTAYTFIFIDNNISLFYSRYPELFSVRTKLKLSYKLSFYEHNHKELEEEECLPSLYHYSGNQCFQHTVM